MLHALCDERLNQQEDDRKKRLAFPIQLLSFHPIISIGSYRVRGASMGPDEGSPAKPIEKCSERILNVARIVGANSIKQAMRDKAAYVGGTDLQLVNINSRLPHSLRRVVQIAPGHVPRRRRTQCERGFLAFGPVRFCIRGASASETRIYMQLYQR